VLVDADLIGFFSERAVEGLMEDYRAGRAQVVKSNPGLARALDAFPNTVTHMRTVSYPVGLPTLDIVAEFPPVPAGPPAEAWRDAHAKFAAADAARKEITAKGSHHFIMRDEPKIVQDAVVELYRKISP
jgi:hypothetical protein